MVEELQLPSKTVIYTVGEGNEDYKLRKAVRSSLILASDKGFRSISMPAISSGIFGFPKIDVQRYLLKNLKHFFKLIMMIVLVIIIHIQRSIL